MTRTLVTYYSQTGNTEKIAKAIYGSIAGDKELMETDKVESTEPYSLVFIGFPIINFGPPAAIREFIRNNLFGKDVAVFITMALTAVPLTGQLREVYDLTMNSCRSCFLTTNLLDIFDCPGELSEKTANALLACSDPQLRSFGMMRPYTIGYPDSRNISDAAVFAEKISMNMKFSKI